MTSSTVSNADAAAAFREIADLLDVLGERFKPEAYRRAARSLESLTENLAAIAARNELRTVPGVGDAIEEKIRELLSTGQIPYLEKLRHDVPPGLLEIMRLPGLGPKTARRFWVELGVEGPAELTAAIAAGRLDGVKGFGPKKIDQIRTALTAAAASGGPTARLPLATAYPIARRLVAALRAAAPVDRIEIAGSFRRGRETVGDLDILVTSTTPEAVFDVFSKLPDVKEIRMRGPTKETVLLASGLQVDLRVVEPAAFGAALQYFTGSKDHNVRLRSLARDKGLKVNEYGVFRGDERVAGATEEDVYAALGLAWMPSELREDRGEIDVASRGEVPRVVAESDLVGDVHVHARGGAESGDVGRVLDEARARKFEYVGVVASGPLPAPAGGRDGPPRLEPVAERQAAEPAPGPGSGGAYWVVRADSGDPPATAWPKTSAPRAVVHLPPNADATSPELRVWLDRARAVGAAVEVGPGPGRLDSVAARLALSLGVRLAIPTGLGAGPDDATLPVAVAFARRAGARPEDVVNARSGDRKPTAKPAARAR